MDEEIEDEEEEESDEEEEELPETTKNIEIGRKNDIFCKKSD